MVATKENKCKERWCNNPTFKSTPYCSIHMTNEQQIRMPMGNAKKVGIVIIIGIVGFFAIGFGWLALWEYYYPEEYAAWEAEIEREERLEAQKRLAEEAQQQKATQIKTSTALPSSCRGVNSMELDLYPTGKQCFSALNKRVEEWCLSQSKDCVTQFYLKLADTCADPILSSVDVCLMYTFKELYPKLIP